MSLRAFGLLRVGPLLARRTVPTAPRTAAFLPRVVQRTPLQSRSEAYAAYATEKDTTVSFKDPTEEEAQRCLELGTLALEMGDLEKAMAEYRKSLEVHENASAYYNLGVCQYQDQNLEGAIASWKEALRLAPDSPDAHTNMASAYVMSKPSRPDLAIEHLRTAAKQSPDDAEIHFNLGAVLEACTCTAHPGEELEDAVQAYKKAFEGGIQVRSILTQRAEQNVRNCTSKLMSARLDVESQKDGQDKK